MRCSIEILASFPSSRALLILLFLISPLIGLATATARWSSRMLKRHTEKLACCVLGEGGQGNNTFLPDLVL